MAFDGLLIGAASFLIIGLFHPLVIKGEYYFSVKIWPVFLVIGLGFATLAAFVHLAVLRAIFGVAAFSSFWSILELFHQKKRVEKGWYPQNPKRKT